MVAVAEVASVQAPLCTIARYCVVVVRLVAVKVVVVLAISVSVVKLSVELSQRMIFPVCPLRVSVVELVPVHTLVLPAMLPPTEVGIIVRDTSSEVKD